MANKRIIELQERTSIDMGDWLIVDSSTSTRKLSLATLFNYMTLTSMIFVTELPTTDISESTIYLVPHSGSTTDWDEYIYRDNEWIQIGTSTIDLSAIYQTKTDNNLQTTSKQIVGAINEVNSGLSSIGGVSANTDAVENLANNMWIEVAKISLAPGKYVVSGYVSYEGTDTVGSRCGRIAYSGFDGSEIEIQPNANGWTRIKVPEIIDLSSKTQNTNVVVQAKQTSGSPYSRVSGQIKAIRIK